MGQKVPPGLVNRGGVWHIQKRFGNGRRIRESTGTSDLREAERYLARKIEEMRNAQVYGVRPDRSFKEAATKFLNESDKTSIRIDAIQLKMLAPFIGDLPLRAVHMGTLQPFIEWRRKQGKKNRTINYALQVVRHILNLAAGEWMDEHGLTLIEHAPKIKLLQENDKRAPYPLAPGEQVKLFAELPEHLAAMALFKVNTGCREAEVCNLKWDWEVKLPEFSTSVFIIPAFRVKNREERLVILNRVAQDIIERVRGVHAEYVFSYKGQRLQRMNSHAWRMARERAGLCQVRVHDLKHTFGRRLRAAGVSFEDRQDLLGHKSGRITTHYSRPELENLIAAANKVCTQGGQVADSLTILRRESA